MSDVVNQRLIRKITHWLLLVVILLYLVSGFGITEFRVVETLTLGLLTKSLAFKMHDVLLIPMLILLVLHMFMPSFLRLIRKTR